MNSIQKQIVDEIVLLVSEDIKQIIADPSISDVITIIKLISNISTMVEIYKVNDKPLKGKDKKNIVHLVCKSLLEEYSNEDVYEVVVDLYDSIYDDMIETMIHFAKNNKLITKVKNCKGGCF